MKSPSNFWNQLEKLLASSQLVVDRPRGSAHPRYPQFVYPYDYGYLEGTRSADGGGVDVWLGSLPDRHLCAVICTVDLLKRETEIKLLLGCTRAEAEHILAIHNDGDQAGWLVWRGDPP